MPLTPSLLSRLHSDHPALKFAASDDFHWSPSSQTIHFVSDATDADQQLLHELGHALLGHDHYTRDIELIGFERDAWHHAVSILGPRYGIVTNETTVKSSLDSYRDWLHDRSTCPNCSATGMEIRKNHYACPACDHQWRVNEARMCGLRRYDIKNNPA